MEAADADRDPAALKGRAQSITRGNWFDCTPTKPTMPKPPCPESGGRCGRAGRGCWSRRRGRSRCRRLRQAPDLHRILRDAEQAGKRIGRQRRLPPLDDVALVVVMRRLDQGKAKICDASRYPAFWAPRNHRRPILAPLSPLLATLTVSSLWLKPQSGGGRDRQPRAAHRLSPLRPRKGARRSPVATTDAGAPSPSHFRRLEDPASRPSLRPAIGPKRFSGHQRRPRWRTRDVSG